MRRLSTLTLFVILISLLTVTLYKAGKHSLAVETSIATLKERGTLNVAMDVNLPGYFTYNDVPYGFQHDVLAEFAKSLDLKLNIVPQKSTANAMAMLDRGEVDIVVTMPKYAQPNNLRVHLLTPVYNTSYVVLTNSKNTTSKRNFAMSDLKDLVSQSNVVLSQGFTATRGYDTWLDSISNTAVISHENSLNLISSLESGSIDFLVCEKLEAQLGCFLSPKVKRIYSFNEEVSSVMFTGALNKQLESTFNCWANEFKGSDEFALLQDMYYNDAFIRQFAKDGYVEPIGGISPYDDVIKRQAIKAGRDWRLVSAIAYSESRFKPNVVSKKGAMGIMQVMPAIARQFDIDPSEVMDAEINIEIALKLMDKIEKSLRFNSSTSDYDRMCIILACYNGGIGHVLDARRLAVKYGANPDKWENVANFLDKKSEEQYYTDETVGNGRFGGSTETLSFVQKVMNRYNHYCAQNKN